jgi:hypothetical protein
VQCHFERILQSWVIIIEGEYSKANAVAAAECSFPRTSLGHVKSSVQVGLHWIRQQQAAISRLPKAQKTTS